MTARTFHGVLDSRLGAGKSSESPSDWSEWQWHRRLVTCFFYLTIGLDLTMSVILLW